MKQLFFSLLLLLSFSVQSQTTYIKCVSYQNFKSSDCQGCGIKEGVFAGLILESSSGIKHALHSPFQVKYSRNNVTITDAYGTIVTRPVASLVMRGAEGRNLNTFLSDCLCNPSTHYVKAITGDFVDLTNPMMPVIAIDSLQVLHSGGTEGQVLAKVDGTNYKTEWVDAGGGGASYLVYKANAVYSGGTLVVNIVYNTLGFTPSWELFDGSVWGFNFPFSPDYNKLWVNSSANNEQFSRIWTNGDYHVQFDYFTSGNPFSIEINYLP